MNIAVTRAAEGLDRRSFTVTDLRRMIDAGIMEEDERVELVEGELVVMAAKGNAHDWVKNGLNMAIVRALPDDAIIAVESSFRFSDTTLLEPDIVVVPRGIYKKSISGFARIDLGDARLVIEVAASSLAYDRGLKARLYARFGAAELWVVDANERVTWVHKGANGDAWDSIVEHGPDDVLTTAALPGCSIKLADID